MPSSGNRQNRNRGQLDARDCTITYRRDGQKLAVAVIHRDLEGLRAEVSFERTIAARERTIRVCNRAGMSERFKVGEHVRWNLEAGHVIDRIVKIHTKDFAYKGYTHVQAVSIPSITSCVWSWRLQQLLNQQPSRRTPRTTQMHSPPHLRFSRQALPPGAQEIRS
jgi:hypothetical protein